MDATPVFEACEHVLDPVALSVGLAVLDTMLGMGPDAERDAAFNDRLADGRGTVGPIGEQGFGGRQILDHCGSGFVIIGLPFA
ncbi:hypothetical protein NKJ42_31060 [Mesorhizobium sp. M0129]